MAVATRGTPAALDRRSLSHLPSGCDSVTMQVVHMGLWKVKADADPEMLRRAAEKVARFKEIVPGCTQSLLAPLYVPTMGAVDQQTFGNTSGFEEMARGYNYILYTV